MNKKMEAVIVGNTKNPVLNEEMLIRFEESEYDSYDEWFENEYEYVMNFIFE